MIFHIGGSKYVTSALFIFLQLAKFQKKRSKLAGRDSEHGVECHSDASCSEPSSDQEFSGVDEVSSSTAVPF
jgi:hypothetical protein